MSAFIYFLVKAMKPHLIKAEMGNTYKVVHINKQSNVPGTQTGAANILIISETKKSILDAYKMPLEMIRQQTSLK